MLESAFLTELMGFLDNILSTYYTVPSDLAQVVSPYITTFQGILANVYYFVPKDLLMIFIPTISFILLIRIILSVVNLAWW